MEFFYRLNNLPVNQLQELIKYQKSLKSKSKISLQIKLILQAYLEMKQKHKIKAETASAMWNEIKGLPQDWQVALGLKMLNLQGCEQVAQYVVEPAVKLALGRSRQFSSYNIRQIAEKLVLIKDDAVIKKVAPPLINYYILEIHKWDANRLKNERAGIARILTLAYRAGNKKLVERLLEDFKMAQYSDSYISLANLGAEKLLKTFLDKNWRNLSFAPRLKLQTKGRNCADKVLKEIKEPEENYLVRTMFAAPSILVKINNRNSYRTQSKARRKLAEEFNNIKFSRKQNEIFCLQILLQNSRDVKILAEKSSKSIFDLEFDDIFQTDAYNFARQIGQFYFMSLGLKNSKEAMKKINEIIKYKNSTNNQTAQRAKNVLNGMAQSYQSMDLRKIKLAQVKEFAKLGLLLLSNDTAGWTGSFKYQLFSTILQDNRRNSSPCLKPFLTIEFVFIQIIGVIICAT